MSFSLFRRKQPPTPEAAFWTWFVDNEPRLSALEGMQDPVLGELAPRLKGVHADLTYEIGPERAGQRDFVISAGGLRSGFPAVESLHAAAPELDRWQWVKFRPRRKPLNDIRYEDTSVRVDDVRYLLAKDGDRIGVVLFFEGSSEATRTTHGNIGFLMLDEALGEFAVETQVGFVESESRESPYFARSRPLRELPEDFDAQIAASTTASDR
jgi:hypothetical protein